MKAKRLFALMLALMLVLGTGTTTFAAENVSKNELQAIEQEMYDYYRDCDEQTGIILEEYDTLLNGNNDIDYVDLATSLSMDKADRIAAMNFITQIYDDVNDSERVYLKSYIKSYAPYTEEEDLHAFCEELVTTVPMARASYTRSVAVDYALEYYNGTNPDYPNLRGLGGDCANFVSQCLLAGGKSMTGDWYIYRKNSVYPAPTSVDELDYSWRLADPSPWISAKEFNNFWSDYATTYTYDVTEYETDHTTIYSKSIYTGDAVQLLSPVLWWYEGYHTMLIVGYDTSAKDFVYAAHSSNTKDSTILDNICGATNGKYDDYQLKFFHIT
jgi:hypothetical protein